MDRYEPGLPPASLAARYSALEQQRKVVELRAVLRAQAERHDFRPG